jgi:hypothetical protein
MEEPTSKTTPDSTNPAGGNPAGAPPSQTAAAAATASAASPCLSVKYLADKLEEAELLLGYAAEVGIKIEDEVRDDVLKARVASDSASISEQTAANLLSALTTLAVDVRPVTVESLRAWANPDEEANKQIRFYTPVAIIVGCVIVIFSLLTFVSKSIADKVSANIETANELASKLRAELGPQPASTNQTPSDAIAGTSNAVILLPDEVWFGPGGAPAGLSDKDVLSDLQQFAASMREIEGYARQLRHCLFESSEPRYSATGTNRAALELTPGLRVRLSQELTDRVAEYQQVRSFGDQVVEKVTVYYGAVATSILPVLYALLGAVAYLLRSYEEQSKNRTLVAGEKPIARLMIAGIGGLVVGQFNNVAQGITISPFAEAFLVGYAVDVFFAFLEGLLQMFRRSPGNPGAQGIPPRQ